MPHGASLRKRFASSVSFAKVSAYAVISSVALLSTTARKSLSFCSYLATISDALFDRACSKGSESKRVASAPKAIA